jgi:ABC-type sugar transport system substrate-binding protein
MPDVVSILAAGLVPNGCTAGQQPAEMGRLGVQAYLDFVAGKDVPSVINIDPVLVTKDNAAGFHW